MFFGIRGITTPSLGKVWTTVVLARYKNVMFFRVRGITTLVLTGLHGMTALTVNI